MAYISYDFYINQLKVEESKNLTKIENNKPVYNPVYIYINQFQKGATFMVEIIRR